MVTFSIRGCLGYVFFKPKKSKQLLNFVSLFAILYGSFINNVLFYASDIVKNKILTKKKVYSFIQIYCTNQYLLIMLNMNM